VDADRHAAADDSLDDQSGNAGNILRFEPRRRERDAHLLGWHVAGLGPPVIQPTDGVGWRGRRHDRYQWVQRCRRGQYFRSRRLGEAGPRHAEPGRFQQLFGWHAGVGRHSARKHRQSAGQHLEPVAAGVSSGPRRHLCRQHVGARRLACARWPLADADRKQQRLHGRDLRVRHEAGGERQPRRHRDRRQPCIDRRYRQHRRVSVEWGDAAPGQLDRHAQRHRRDGAERRRLSARDQQPGPERPHQCRRHRAAERRHGPGGASPGQLRQQHDLHDPQRLRAGSPAPTRASPTTSPS